MRSLEATLCWPDKRLLLLQVNLLRHITLTEFITEFRFIRDPSLISLDLPPDSSVWCTTPPNLNTFHLALTYEGQHLSNTAKFQTNI